MTRISRAKGVSLKVAKAAAAPVSKRLPPALREKQILEGAISFFSEVGFTGQTRELSRRLGITQPLLYRYYSPVHRCALIFSRNLVSYLLGQV